MKLIELPHKVCGMTCMVNGIEDLYESKTGRRLPDWLLFFASGLGNNFAYLKNSRAPAPRMVMWGVPTKRQYEALAGIVGFTWGATEGRSFSYALKRAQEYIDQNTPVILGALDMYHLPYYDKFYHTFHIPIHYVLMVGYDPEQQAILVHDCDRRQVQTVPYSDLRLAWDVNLPGLSDKNTLFAFEFNEQVADAFTIARRGLRRCADSMLNPPASMFGLRGMSKLARELPRWPQELNSRQLEASLLHLVEYTGFPPNVPNRITGYDAPDNHTAGRDGFAALLKRLAKTYSQPGWKKAAAPFDQSGQAIRQFTDLVVDYIQARSSTLDTAAEMILRIVELEEQGYRLIAQNADPL